MKNPDRRALRRHFLVPDSPVTMAPKLDKVMAAECLPGVRSTDQSLARLQALMLDAVGPLTDLLEKMGNSEDGNEETLDFQVVEDTIQSALAFLGNAATQFSIYRRTKILEEYNKELVSFSEELEPCRAPSCRPIVVWAILYQASGRPFGSSRGTEESKREGQKSFYKAPPAETVTLAGGEQALLSTAANIQPGDPQEQLPRSRST